MPELSLPGVAPARGRIELQLQAVERIGQGDLAVRMKAKSAGELRVLEDGINAMADSLQALRDNLEARIAQASGQLAQRERANAAKSRFLAVASHDLRQPIHALGLFVARLRDLVGQGGVPIACVVIAGHSVVVAIGVSAGGGKHPLGLTLGATENATAITDLLADLIKRGLDPGRKRFVVIDGSKA